MRVEVLFYYDTPDGRVYYTPDTASLITRPLGGGATVETIPDLCDGSHRFLTGVYYFTTGEEGGEYEDDTWYENEVTWTKWGETHEVSRPFFYNILFSPLPVPPEGARLIRAANLVVVRLNSEVLSQGFTAVRKSSILYSIKELATLRVTVVPAKRRLTQASRADIFEDYEIVIGVQRRLQPTLVEDEVGDMTYLVEELIDLLVKDRAFSDLRLIEIENNPAISPEHIRPHHVFTSIITTVLRASI